MSEVPVGSINIKECDYEFDKSVTEISIEITINDDTRIAKLLILKSDEIKLLKAGLNFLVKDRFKFVKENYNDYETLKGCKFVIQQLIPSVYDALMQNKIENMGITPAERHKIFEELPEEQKTKFDLNSIGYDMSMWDNIILVIWLANVTSTKLLSDAGINLDT